ILVDVELLVELRQVDELQRSLLREPRVEEVERDDVLEEFVRRLGHAQVEAVLSLERAPDQEFDADRRLAGPDGTGDEDRVPSRDAPVQDVVNRIDAGHASLTLAGV